MFACVQSILIHAYNVLNFQGIVDLCDKLLLYGHVLFLKIQ